MTYCLVFELSDVKLTKTSKNILVNLLVKFTLIFQ